MAVRLGRALDGYCRTHLGRQTAARYASLPEACLIWICAGNSRVGHGLGLRYAAVAPTLGPRDTDRQHRRAAVPDGVQARGWLRERAHNRGAGIANSNLHRRHLKSAARIAMGRSLFVKSILDVAFPGCCRGGCSKKSQARAFARRAAH